MIPEEAIEAAAKAALGRNLNKRTLELILEAAAPHILAAENSRRHAEALAEYPHDMITTVMQDGNGFLTKTRQPLSTFRSQS